MRQHRQDHRHFVCGNLLSPQFFVFCFLFFFTRSQHLYLSLFVLIFSYFRLCWVLVAVYELSLVAVSRGYSQVAVYGLLIAGASLVAEHGS